MNISLTNKQENRLTFATNSAINQNLTRIDFGFVHTKWNGIAGICDDIIAQISAGVL